MSYKIFERLCKEKEVSVRKVALATDIDSGTFTHWKRGDYEPKADKRKRIAEYFGVTLDYLDTGKTDDPVLIERDKMRDEVRALADLATKADPEQVKLATAFLKTIMSDE